MDTTATAGEVDIEEGQRPTALLPVSHLLAAIALRPVVEPRRGRGQAPTTLHGSESSIT